MAVLNINMPLFPTHQHSQEKTQIFTFRYTDLTKARVILILCPLFGKKKCKKQKTKPKTIWTQNSRMLPLVLGTEESTISVLKTKLAVSNALS